MPTFDVSDFRVIKSDTTLVEEGKSALDRVSILVPPGITLFIDGKWGPRNRVAVCPRGRVYFGCSFEPSFESGPHCTNLYLADSAFLEGDDGEIDRAERITNIYRQCDFLYPSYITPQLGSFPKSLSAAELEATYQQIYPSDPKLKKRRLIERLGISGYGNELKMEPVGYSSRDYQFGASFVKSVNKTLTKADGFVILEPGATARVDSDIKFSAYLCPGSTLTIDADLIHSPDVIVCPGAVLRVTDGRNFLRGFHVWYYPGAILDIGVSSGRDAFNWRATRCHRYGVPPPKWLNSPRAIDIMNKFIGPSLVDFSKAGRACLVKSHQEIGNSSPDGFRDVKKIVCPGGSVVAYGQWLSCEVVVCDGGKFRFEEVQNAKSWRNITQIHVMSGGTLEMPEKSIVSIVQHDAKHPIELVPPDDVSVDMNYLGCSEPPLFVSAFDTPPMVQQDVAKEFVPLSDVGVSALMSHASRIWDELDPAIKSESLLKSTFSGFFAHTSPVSAPAAKEAPRNGPPIASPVVGSPVSAPAAKEAPRNGPPIASPVVGSPVSAPAAKEAPVSAPPPPPAGTEKESSGAPPALTGTFQKQGSFIPTWRSRYFTLSVLGFKYMSSEGTVRGSFSPDQIVSATCTKDPSYPRNGVILQCRDDAKALPFHLRLWFCNPNELDAFYQSLVLHQLYFNSA